VGVGQEIVLPLSYRKKMGKTGKGSLNEHEKKMLGVMNGERLRRRTKVHGERRLGKERETPLRGKSTKDASYGGGTEEGKGKP